MIRTKIICTLGPATDAPGVLERMIQAGMSVARLNASHGEPETHERRLQQVRALSEKLRRPIGILVDLPGPKFRLGHLEQGPLELRRGARVTLAAEREQAAGAIPVNHPRLAQDVQVGEHLFLADGTVKLTVEEIKGPLVSCRVEAGGVLRSGSGLNLPDSALNVELPTPKDADWIRFAVAQKAEWIGVSFVRTAEDLVRVRRLLKDTPEPPLVMAKIEKRQALEHLNEITAEADAVMVARGDLGVETPLAEVPVVQKRIIAAASAAGKPSVTATQMLESMVEDPSPTRAEVTDVANAILDGSDAVMLSAETALGKYPVEAVEMLAAVSAATEADYPYGALLNTAPRGTAAALGKALSSMACRLAMEIQAKAILVPAGSSRAAFQVARFRPEAPIIAFSTSPLRCRQLTVVWNVHPLVEEPTGGSWLQQAARWLQDHRLAAAGDRAVVLSDVSVQVIRL